CRKRSGDSRFLAEAFSGSLLKLCRARCGSGIIACMTHIIAEPCIGTKDPACVDVCPVDCIYGKNEDWEMLYMHPEECIDCGLCIDACPVEGIFPLEEVPDKWKRFIPKTYGQFGLTPPGPTETPLLLSCRTEPYFCVSPTKLSEARSCSRGIGESAALFY